jgi:hypothetical protein
MKKISDTIRVFRRMPAHCRLAVLLAPLLVGTSFAEPAPVVGQGLAFAGFPGATPSAELNPLDGQQSSSPRPQPDGRNAPGVHRPPAPARPGQGEDGSHTKPPRLRPGSTLSPGHTLSQGKPPNTPPRPAPGPARPPVHHQPPNYPPPRPPVYHHMPYGHGNPHYAWGYGNGGRLRRFFLGDARYIYRPHRRLLFSGGYLPGMYLKDMEPIPPTLMKYLPRVPRGFEIGYYDGYCLVYDPEILWILSAIDLYRY